MTTTAFKVITIKLLLSTSKYFTFHSFLYQIFHSVLYRGFTEETLRLWCFTPKFWFTWEINMFSTVTCKINKLEPAENQIVIEFWCWSRNVKNIYCLGIVFFACISNFTCYWSWTLPNYPKIFKRRMRVWGSF